MKQRNPLNPGTLNPLKPIYEFIADRSLFLRRLAIVMIVLISHFGFSCLQTHAETLFVPETYPTLEAAVSAAKDGDSLYVGPGTYYEFDILIEKDLSIYSIMGPSQTIIDCEYLGRGFILDSMRRPIVKIHGFTIQNAQIPYLDAGGALLVKSGTCQISNCIVQGSRGDADYSAATLCNRNSSQKSLLIENCVVRDNFAANGVGISHAIVQNTWVHNNIGGNNCSAVGDSLVTNCTIYGNGGGWIPNAWTVGGGTGGYWKNCIIWNNLPSHNDQELYEPAEVSYCIIKGGYPGDGNLADDPLFVDAPGGNFDVSDDSLAIGGGDPKVLNSDGSRSNIGAWGDINAGFPLVPPCSQSNATATATIVNGFVVGTTLVHPGCGYTVNPNISIQGGQGEGAAAMAVIQGGEVVDIIITNAGSGYREVPELTLEPPNQCRTPFLDGLLAFYPFDSNADDESGRGRHLESHEVSFESDAGWPSSPMAKFDKPESFLFGFHETLNLQNNWTWGAWVELDEDNENVEFEVLFSEGVWDELVVIIGINPQLNAFTVSSRNHQRSVNPWKEAQFPIETGGGFHHFAVTLAEGAVDQGILKLYVDGQPAGVADLQQAELQYDEPTSIALGEDVRFVLGETVSPGFFRGTLDGVRIYDRALSENEIKNLYAFELANQPKLKVRVKSIEVTLQVIPGTIYQLQTSNNLTTWSNAGEPFLAASPEILRDFDAIEVGRFFRLVSKP